MSDFTVAQGEYLDWTELDDTASDSPSVSTGEETIPAGALQTTLHIVVAHKDANDAGASYVTVSVYIQGGGNDNDEDWRLWHESQAGGDQATTEALNANSGVSQANPERLEVADTTDWDTGAGENLFLLDAGTLADSCLVKIIGWADNDYYINAWELERDYDSSDALFDGVDFINVMLPPGAEKCLVVLTNAHGTATYAVRVDYSAVTDIE